eukprot:TRINITY_DN13020_c0_g1_i1.p1 TRINITY_DN13020_c0_g1~~TRINITY_DN13020_c0_g1_i1.p1  ORF type:complete len:442 (+),score=65.09 TRINITY_DN13020_c0_g1_i1:91-1416(+)
MPHGGGHHGGHHGGGHHGGGHHGGGHHHYSGADAFLYAAAVPGLLGGGGGRSRGAYGSRTYGRSSEPSCVGSCCCSLFCLFGIYCILHYWLFGDDSDKPEGPPPPRHPLQFPGAIYQKRLVAGAPAGPAVCNTVTTSDRYYLVFVDPEPASSPPATIRVSTHTARTVHCAAQGTAACGGTAPVPSNATAPGMLLYAAPCGDTAKGCPADYRGPLFGGTPRPCDSNGCCACGGGTPSTETQIQLQWSCAGSSTWHSELLEPGASRWLPLPAACPAVRLRCPATAPDGSHIAAAAAEPEARCAAPPEAQDWNETLASHDYSWLSYWLNAGSVQCFAAQAAGSDVQVALLGHASFSAWRGSGGPAAGGAASRRGAARAALPEPDAAAGAASARRQRLQRWGAVVAVAMLAAGAAAAARPRLGPPGAPDGGAEELQPLLPDGAAA